MLVYSVSFSIILSSISASKPSSSSDSILYARTASMVIASAAGKVSADIAANAVAIVKLQQATKIQTIAAMKDLLFRFMTSPLGLNTIFLICDS